MKLEEFKNDVEEKRSKQKALKETIENNKAALITLEKEYKEALLNDNDKEADSLFPQIEQLKESIKRNEHKTKTLQTIYSEGIKENALKTVLGLKEVQATYQSKADELDSKAMPLMQQLEALKQKGYDLEKEFNNEKDRYMILVDQYGLDTREIAENGLSQRTRIEPFKLSLLNQQVTQRPNSAVARRAIKQVLPENATIQEIAQSKRIIGGK